ncbi:MAG: peroxiredoxin [Clostridia bacterium]
MIFEDIHPLKIGNIAPSFSAVSTCGALKLSDYLGKWVLLFSHPGDFTPVCTTEFIALAKINPEFEKRNCCLIGLSIDSNPSHLAWVNNIHKSTGVEIPFPVISDLDMKISKSYGMIAPNVSNTQTVRNVFFIDPDQKIRCILQYPMTTGRNTGELLRILDSLLTTDKEGVATPVNWLPGQPTIVPSPKTYCELVERLNNPLGYNCLDWYLCFNQTVAQMGTMSENTMMQHSNFSMSNMNLNYKDNCNCK